ncbi:3-beta-hydroxysteroid-Delta(8),Delta(7)-isomerase [Nemania serpens]|nr:3-beta-hydroxysteroid-Delta(8),Delta(7)-isomerase [Nemania serpens]
MNGIPDTPRQHPYYPLGVAIPGYVAKVLTTQAILAIFTTTCLGILIPTCLYIRHARRDLPSGEVLTALWFVLCGFIHLGLEGKPEQTPIDQPTSPKPASQPPKLTKEPQGYFALNAHSIASRSAIPAQLWKEYAFSDSRYLTADTFVVCMETITAVFWGPLSFLCAWCILADHPLRHPLQSIVSLGQLYGDVLYYATFTFDFVISGIEYSRPEPAYFWGYFVFLNAFWIVIPTCLLARSTRETARAFTALKQASPGGRAK